MERMIIREGGGVKERVKMEEGQEKGGGKRGIQKIKPKYPCDGIIIK